MSEIFSLGLDLGGTKVEAAVIRRRGLASDASVTDAVEVLARRRVPTEAERGYDAILANAVALMRATATEAGVDVQAIPVGVGMPGSVTRRDGLVKNSNTQCLNGRPFREDLSAALGRPVLFENDANCFAIAEARFGAGRAYGDGVVFGAILGSGVGGGIVVRRRVWGGIQGLGGEWGHHAVGPWRRPDASSSEPCRQGLSERAPCPCGKMGCLELYLSGGGAEREYLRRAGRAKKLAELAETRESDPNAAFVMDELHEAFGRGLANLIDILDPSVIVLGGGVSNLPSLYDEGRERVRRYVFNEELETPIVKHELGDSAGVIGAALLDEMAG